MRPCQIRSYTTERAVNRRGRRGRLEVRRQEILRDSLGVLGLLGGETVMRPPAAARNAEADAAFAWGLACGREADGSVPANQRAHTSPGREKHLLAIRDRRRGPCWK